MKDGMMRWREADAISHKVRNLAGNTWTEQGFRRWARADDFMAELEELVSKYWEEFQMTPEEQAKFKKASFG